MAILLFTTSTIFCRSSAFIRDTLPPENIPRLITDSTESLVPVKVRGTIWYAMSRGRLNRISNHIAKLERQVAMIPAIDSARIACNELQITNSRQIKDYERSLLSCENDLIKQEKAIKDMERLMEDCDVIALDLGKKNKKLKRINKWLSIGGGFLIVSFAAALLIVAL